VISVESIGKTINDREIKYIHFGSEEGDLSKTANSILIIGGFDGSRTSPVLVKNLAKHLATTPSPAFTQALQTSNVYLLPILNPDGY
jgi:murein tripeptide amidase MpaA